MIDRKTVRHIPKSCLFHYTCLSHAPSIACSWHVDEMHCALLFQAARPTQPVRLSPAQCCMMYRSSLFPVCVFFPCPSQATVPILLLSRYGCTLKPLATHHVFVFFVVVVL